jgi:hypothetical protein
MSTGIVTSLGAAGLLAPKWGEYPNGRNESVSIEPDTAWWTGNSRFGRRQNYVLPLIEGSPVDVVDTGHLPGPPRLVTFNLIRDNPPGGAAGPINAEFRALLTWGSGGISRSMLVDWGPLGGAFALQCNTLRITAISYALETLNLADAVVPYNPLTLAGVQARYLIGASIGIDGSSPALPPTFSTDCRALTAINTQASYLVPHFARRVIPLLGTDTPAAAVAANYQIAIVGDVQVLAKYTLTDAMLQNGLALPCGARAVNLLKGGAVPDARSSLLFQLGM